MKVAGTFISTYSWDYNDGTPVNPSKTDSIVAHVYDNAGKYIPNVVLISPEGCPFTLRTPYTVIVDEAKAAFSFDKDKFCDIYEWFFGDNSISPLKDPVHTYQRAGVYDIKLVVTSEHGCN